MGRVRGFAPRGKVAVLERKKLFVSAYLANGMNAGDAARKAGYSVKGAVQRGYQLLLDPTIQEMIAVDTKKKTDKYDVSTELVIKSIAQELKFDPINLFNADGSLKALAEMDEDTRACLTSIEVMQVGGEESPATLKKIKWSQKATGREQAMKFLGMFAADNKQKIPEQEQLPLAEICRRIIFALEMGSRTIDVIPEKPQIDKK